MSARVALVAGAVGRRGEALLNRVLGSGDYAGVVVLADAPMALGVRALALAGPDELPRIDDAFLMLSDPDEAGSRSFYGRDAPFVQVHEGNCLRVAQRAAAAGATRTLLVSPAPAWQQVGRFHSGLTNATELAIAQLPFRAFVVLRPVQPARRAAGNLLQRFAAAYISVQMLMMPRSLDVITSEQLARCALAAMRRAADGVRVFGAQQLAALLEPGD